MEAREVARRKRKIGGSESSGGVLKYDDLSRWREKLHVGILWLGGLSYQVQISHFVYLPQWVQVLTARNEWVDLLLHTNLLMILMWAILEEVVLFVLLRSFKFSVSDKDVVWRMGGPLPAPTVNGIIQLPLKVEMVL